MTISTLPPYKAPRNLTLIPRKDKTIFACRLCKA